MSNLDRLKAAYAEWDGTKGANPAVWEDLFDERIALSHVDGTQPGLSFAKNTATRAEAMRYLSAIFDEWEMLRFQPEEYVSQDSCIAMFGRCAFRHKLTGKTAELTMAALWTFDGDRAVALREVYDTAVAAAAAMPDRPAPTVAVA